MLTLVAYAVLVAWPLRIWVREVSPHTHLVGTFGIDRVGALRYTATVVILFVLYGAALWLVACGRARIAVWQAVTGAALFCLVLLPTHPLTSTDLFNYMLSARVQWVHGANPLITPPLAYPDDPWLRLLFFWREVPSPYGPLWSLITLVPHTLGGGDLIATVIAYKVTAVVGLLTASVCAGMAAERLRPGRGGLAALALAWNPLVVWHTAGNGHNDAVFAAFLALAALLLVSGQPEPALVAFTASVLVKFATALTVPLVLVWWWRRRPVLPLSGLLPGIAASAALTAVAYAPYWAWLDTFRTALNEGMYFAVSGPAVLRGALLRLTDVSRSESIAAWTGRLAFLVVYLWLAWWLWRQTPPASRTKDASEPLLAAACGALAAYLIAAATYFAPWYVLWPWTLAVIVNGRPRVLLPVLGMTLGAMGVLVWATWARARWSVDPLGDWYPMHVLSFLSVLVPAAVCWRLAQWLEGRRLAQPSANIDAPVLQRQVTGTRVER